MEGTDSVIEIDDLITTTQSYLGLNHLSANTYAQVRSSIGLGSFDSGDGVPLIYAFLWPITRYSFCAHFRCFEIFVLLVIGFFFDHLPFWVSSAFDTLDWCLTD